MSRGSEAPSATAAIELRGIVKDFAIGLRGLRLRALDGVSLRVMPGEVYGLLGPNGSGKSTAIKLMLGLLTPSAGSCTLFGRPSTQVGARRNVGYLPETPNFYEHLSGRELVRFYGRMCDLRGPALEARIDHVLAQVGLSASAAARRVRTYSKGMLQRVGLAQALVHDPRLLILDEPTAGLDPLGAAAVSDLIRRLKAEGRTVLITSHLLAQMEEVCDRIAILARGRLILEGAVPDVLGPGAVGTAAGGSTRTRLDRLFIERVGTSEAW